MASAAGSYTPKATVGSNDVALGRVVEAISHSRFWAETAIFVIEDDAQNGPDHVDVHRTVGLVISPYTKQGFVDSTHYTTASMVRTMELILGLPHHDAIRPRGHAHVPLVPKPREPVGLRNPHAADRS